MQRLKVQISFAVTGKLISAFVFATQILFSLNQKFKVSSFLQCVVHGWKPRLLVFSCTSASENQQFAYAKTKAQTSFAVTVKLISAFVFATLIVQFLFFLNPKVQAPSL